MLAERLVLRFLFTVGIDRVFRFAAHDVGDIGVLRFLVKFGILIDKFFKLLSKLLVLLLFACVVR